MISSDDKCDKVRRYDCMVILLEEPPSRSRAGDNLDHEYLRALHGHLERAVSHLSPGRAFKRLAGRKASGRRTQSSSSSLPYFPGILAHELRRKPWDGAGHLRGGALTSLASFLKTPSVKSSSHIQSCAAWPWPSLRRTYARHGPIQEVS